MSLRPAAAGLALAGAGIAAYLTWTHATGTAPVCTSGGCETVQRSRYSELAGLPVAALGLAAYVTILGLVLLDTPTLRVVAAALAAVALAFSLYLLVLQLFVIDAICTWCIGNDAVALTLAAVTMIRARQTPD